MIENYLLQLGMKCGTVKNFSAMIENDMRTNSKQHWYFLTPIKIIGKKAQLKETTIQMAFPFIATKEDISEAAVLKRLTPKVLDYQTELLKQLRKMLDIADDGYIFSIIPFWANEKGERTERKDLGKSRVHIINAQITVKYREHWFTCNC